MDLWIRSQDKKILIKNDSLAIEVSGEYSVITNGYNILGKYRTEERALEVLDEIVSRIEENMNGPIQLVYQMPQE